MQQIFGVMASYRNYKLSTRISGKVVRFIGLIDIRANQLDKYHAPPI
jgi:hypothetical protein